MPGSIFSPASKYTNRMIKEGAKLVADYSDILEELNLPEIGERPVKGSERQSSLELAESAQREMEDEMADLEEGEVALLGQLSGEPVHVDDLSRVSGLHIATIMSMLTLLELKGKVTQVGTMHYVRASASGVTHGS